MVWLSSELAGAHQDADILVLQPLRDVGRLLPCQVQEAIVDVLEVGAHHGHKVPPSTSNFTPSSPASPTRVMRSAVAIRVLEGTTSVSTADPPRPARSMMVTCAPSDAATIAAS